VVESAKNLKNLMADGFFVLRSIMSNLKIQISGYLKNQDCLLLLVFKKLIFKSKKAKNTQYEKDLLFFEYTISEHSICQC
jgi:hypothetical protein